jgi:hypothetical protein
MIAILGALIVSGCEENPSKEKEYVEPHPFKNDQRIGTLIDFEVVGHNQAYGRSRLYYYIDTDGDFETPEYVGSMGHPSNSRVKNAFTYKDQHRKETMAFWGYTLSGLTEVKKGDDRYVYFMKYNKTKDKE